MAVTFGLTGTALYTPDDAVAAGYARFLRWQADGAPASLSLDQIWPAGELSKNPGWFAFVDGPVPSGFETAFRDLLKDAGSPLGFAWVSVAGAAPVLQAAAPVTDAAGARTLAASVTFPLPPGMLELGFGLGAPVVGAKGGDGMLAGFAFTFPPVAGAAPPTGAGLALPLSGAATGALGFDGLMSAGTIGTGVVKQLWNVQIDPLRPFDATRTWQAYTSAAFLLTAADGAYHLAPLA